MTATVHLPSGPCALAAIDRLLDRVLPCCRRDPGSVLWLAPTGLAVVELRQRLFDRGGLAGLRLATFRTLVAEVLDEALLETQPVTSAQRRLLLEEVVARVQAAGGLRHFAEVASTPGFARGLLGLIDDLGQAGVAPATLARAAYRRGEGSEAATRRLGKAVIRLKDHECARLYARYQRELRRAGCHDEQGGDTLAARLLPSARPPLLDGVTTVVLAGFSDFTPAQYDLLAGLAGRVSAIHVALFDESGDDRVELFSRPRRTRAELLQRLGASAAPVQTGPDGDPTVDRPAGLAHLTSQLFRPLRRLVVADDATGLACIHAPGVAGEVRLVARAVKEKMLAGVPAADIDLVVRDLNTYADLLRDVFRDYDVPLDVEGGDPLDRQPVIAALLRALRLPQDDFPFAGVTALLRQNRLRPVWPQTDGQSDLPLKAEALLRLLGEPRGRVACLAAVDRWAEAEQPGLEDEDAEALRRRRTHELAAACRPFLHRFFACWDEAPRLAALDTHVAWLARLVEALGFRQGDDDEPAWQTLWGEIAAWQALHRRSAAAPIDQRTFLRRLTALTREAVVPRGDGSPGRVRALSAGQARHVRTGHRFVLGLGERSFPRLGDRPSLFDDGDREGLRGGGVRLGSTDELADEMLLFYQVVRGARTSLTLSYPAVDERGQEMLPSAFLLAVRDCFRESAIPVESRRMRVEGLGSDRPLSPAEYRVQVAARWPHGAERLPDATRLALTDAAGLVQHRFGTAEFTPYDGFFADPFYREWAGRRLGRERVFSPTALEDYVACPFRFFLGHVLHLEPLEEPSEEIEVARRGMTYHRALARLHRRLRQQGVHAPAEGVAGEVAAEIQAAVDEDVQRASGPAARELWRLEGERLLRSAARYPEQWIKLVDPWKKQGVHLQPLLFEADFGLPDATGQVAQPPLVLRGNGVEVRLWGRIDRVDVAELPDGLGFWIIDYKTGRAGNYTATDVSAFRKLQLALYTLAVEGILLEGRNARPLGLAYWLVGDGGPKVALPGRNVTAWLDSGAGWATIRATLIDWVTRLVARIRQGQFPLAPRSEHCTLTCPYSQICRISQARAVGKVWDLPLPGQGGATS